MTTPDDLTAHLDQRTYEVTPSTGVVHSMPCIRATARRPLPWPEFYDSSDRACSKCLPDGLPAVAMPTRDSWVVDYAVRFARSHMKDSR